MPRSFPELQELSLQELSDALTSSEAYTALASRLVKHASALQVRSMKAHACGSCCNVLQNSADICQAKKPLASARCCKAWLIEVRWHSENIWPDASEKILAVSDSPHKQQPSADGCQAGVQVSESMRTQACEMAENNLAQEQVMGELRNQIAIIR